MPVKFDSKTLERFRTMSPQEICREVTETVHLMEGPKGSEDFVDALDSLVDEGLLSWDEIQNFDPEDED